MHGSADNIAGKGLLNPIATLRAAAYAAENWLGVPRATGRMEGAIKKAVGKKYVTSDMGGSRTTDQVTDFILSHLE
jgi:isocitrate/isopropylmalate dehydrogenase